ncbi:hypothetical protein DNHGIG_39030 [Collibacillus ludicampi]|jgi:hypothetical protein|uniref:DUF3055 domain-containing protein n=1 Tax=Collibacillus ludicampi TaxID=2771369 RepID=A0AAV4LMA5_9BACL|nr:SAV0927 family protein [Collibacillus ludicampi]GIM48354.1 hypothetical protein DNHGIG_39030 [Collibacillus ludicampi]
MEHILFDEMETTRTRHIGFISGGKRFDFMLTFSEHFLGKTVVLCLQSKRGDLLDSHDVHDVDLLCRKFAMTPEDASHLSNALQTMISDEFIRPQYMD